jgi:hypothetical protein
LVVGSNPTVLNYVMRRPNHIILDFEMSKSVNSSSYWALNQLVRHNETPSFLNDLDIHTKYQQSSNTQDTPSIYKNQQKFTTKSNKAHYTDFLRSWEKDGITKIFKPTSASNTKTSKHLLKYSHHKGRDAYMHINLPSDQYCQRSIKHLLVRSSTLNQEHSNKTLNTWFNTVNINFLRKERLYTKLKYSRSPAYDIVSGGAAALLAGFIGFLITEKFGYELIDSGDFYYLFMYVVFLVFSIRPLLTVSDASKGFYDVFSLKRVVAFYLSLLQIVLKRFK